MDSTNYTDIVLPHPDPTSTNFKETVDELDDLLDSIINSMMKKVAISMDTTVEAVQADIDKLEDDEHVDEKSNKESTKKEEGRSLTRCTCCERCKGRSRSAQ
jgi:hypothetical protein